MPRERRLVVVLLVLVLGMSVGLALARGGQLELGARIESGGYMAFNAHENGEHQMRGLRELWTLGGWRLCVILLLTAHFPRWLRGEAELVHGKRPPAARGLDLWSTWRTLALWTGPRQRGGMRELATAFFIARVVWLGTWSAAHAATVVALSSPPLSAHRAPHVLGVCADIALVHAALFGLLLVQRARSGTADGAGVGVLVGRE